MKTLLSRFLFLGCILTMTAWGEQSGTASKVLENYAVRENSNPQQCQSLTTWEECGTNPACYWDGSYNGSKGWCIYVGQRK